MSDADESRFYGETLINPTEGIKRIRKAAKKRVIRSIKLRWEMVFGDQQPQAEKQAVALVIFRILAG